MTRWLLVPLLVYVVIASTIILTAYFANRDDEVRRVDVDGEFARMAAALDTQRPYKPSSAPYNLPGAR